MPRLPAFVRLWVDVFWNDPDRPVQMGKRVLLAVTGFAGAFVGAYPGEMLALLHAPDTLVEPVRWLGITLAGGAGWGHANTEAPPNAN